MKTMFRYLVVATLCVAFLAGLWAANPPRSEARGSTWTVTAFDNPDLNGAPRWTGISPTISYTWGAGAPVINGVDTAPFGVPVNNFSVRFTSSVLFAAGTYRFTVQVDDGARLYVDGLLLINGWQSGLGLRTLQADQNFVVDGTHTITVEMFDAVGDATIIANWAIAVGPLITPTTFFAGIPWNAQFYPNIDLSGAPVYATTFPPSGLNLNWGQGSPGGTVPVDNFSARITRTLTVPTDLPEGVYTFYAKADDNFRFIIDTSPIFDYWTIFEDGKLYTANVTLLNGPHNFIFEYRDISVNAYAFLTWTPPSAQNPVLNPDGTGGVPVGGTTGGATGTPGFTGVTATVTSNTLNVRAEPNTSAAVLTKISKGQSFPVTGRTADAQWAQLNVNGTIGWCAAQFLSFVGDFNSVPVVSGGGTAGAATPVPQPTGVRGMVMGNLRIRSGPSTRTAQIGIMPWGAQVDILGRDQTNSWYQLNYNGLVGWSYAPWIRLLQGTFDALPFTDGSQPAFPPAQPTSGVIVQAYGNVRIRTGPGLQFARITRVVWGTRIEVIGRSPDGRWYKVRYGDVVGWTFATWYRVVQGDIAAVPVTSS